MPRRHPLRDVPIHLYFNPVVSFRVISSQFSEFFSDPHAVLMLSPLDSLRRDDAGEAGAELSDEAELVHDLGDPVLPSGESSRAGPRPRRSLLRPEPCRCSSPVSHGNLGGVYCRPVLPSGELS